MVLCFGFDLECVCACVCFRKAVILIHGGILLVICTPKANSRNLKSCFLHRTIYL
jgi:hypothetical protein